MAKLIERIDSPTELRQLNVSDLEILARETRDFIIETTAKTGGHVGASLGAVELTLALHYVYETPIDKVIWDIGHQAYAHKILTGRKPQFPSIRQLQGLSGFLKRQESPYDVWEAGHAATSLSAALGITAARDLQNASYNVVSVIGDGALTAGMAFEALNQIAHLRSKMVIVVNDNSMSIAPNVGALSRYLTDLRSAPTYARMKQDVENILEAIPVFGGPIRRSIERLKDLIHYMIIPGNIFEELGFKYYGPVDGHNVLDLISVFRNARMVDGPVVVHVITQKGKGYKPAEDKPMQWHGPGPFEVASGEFIKKSGTLPSYSQVFSETLTQLAEKHSDIVAITAAMPDGTKLDIFQAAFPQRFFDVGIAEQHAATFAAGLAIGGMRPVFAVYSTFLQRAYDQVIHDICHQNLPVVLGVDRAGLVGADGATHQGVFDISFLRAIPNMEVAMGKNEDELRSLLQAALQRPNPVAIRYPRGSGQGVDLQSDINLVDWGRGEWIHEGVDVTLVAFGPITYTALKARERLQERGLSVGVVNARFVKPLDEVLLRNVANSTTLMVTLEEHVRTGGFGSAVLEWASSARVATPIEVVALPDEFVDHGPVDYYLDLYELSADAIARKVEDWLGSIQSQV